MFPITSRTMRSCPNTQRVNDNLQTIKQLNTYTLLLVSISKGRKLELFKNEALYTYFFIPKVLFNTRKQS